MLRAPRPHRQDRTRTHVEPESFRFQDELQNGPDNIPRLIPIRLNDSLAPGM